MLVTLPVLATLSVPPLFAQEGWDPVPVNAPADRLLSIGVEVGKPLIAGLEGSYNFSPHTSAHLGFSTLGGFTAISGELRLYLLPFGLEQALPYAGAGFTQYFLAEGSRETSPIAAHGLLGVEYVFLSYLGVSMNLGYQEALGSSEDRTVERYDIHDDVGDWFFAVNARYFF